MLCGLLVFLFLNEANNGNFDNIPQLTVNMNEDVLTKDLEHKNRLHRQTDVGRSYSTIGGFPPSAGKPPMVLDERCLSAIKSVTTHETLDGPCDTY